MKRAKCVVRALWWMVSLTSGYPISPRLWVEKVKWLGLALLILRVHRKVMWFCFLTCLFFDRALDVNLEMDVKNVDSTLSINWKFLPIKARCIWESGRKL